MAVAFSARVDGLDQLETIITDLRTAVSDDETRNVVVSAARSQGRKVVNELKRLTPRSNVTPKERLHLQDAIRGRIRVEPDGNISFYGGYRRGRKTGIRWQQVLAIEFGSRGYEGLNPITTAMANINGPDGENFRRDIVANLGAAIDRAIRKAERNRDARAAAALRNVRRG